MNCAACGHQNPERAKFCLECGRPFALRCASCGVELPPAAKFCLECGTATGTAAPKPAPTPSPAASDARKVVTIVFADLVGSTALHERLDAEAVRGFMESYYAAMRSAVEAHGGRVTQLMGDGVKAVFGAPRVAEDDAIRAVRAAVAMQEGFRALAAAQRERVGKTGLRVAVNTGEVVANDATEIIGDPVNVAARLQEQGKDGDVVIGGSTQRIVAALVSLELLGRFALKGRSEPVEAYRVVSLEPPAAAKAAPFVGRSDELARLDAVYDTAVAKPAAGLAVLVGSPGLGKSRLVDEFARRRAEAATVIRAHCDAAGGATFAPLAQALRETLGIEASASGDALLAAVTAALPDEPDRARIAGGIAALLAGSPGSPEETFFVVRRLLAALAREKPVVLVIDDLHWSEPLLLDLVEHLIQWGSGVPLCVLVGARPELRELRSSLVTPGGFVADVVTLAGLDAAAAMRLAASVVGAADLPAAIAGKVLATSEGNPLFVAELVRMLVQEGALVREGERWSVGANLASLEMPPTIHALLAARIERLRPEERTVLERAAVVGRHFSRRAVAALLPGEAGDLDARLEALRRSELIERDTGWLLGEPVLRFHHVLIRDAAYRRLLKGTRAELHAQLADWIEAQAGDAPEHDETIGWHLEQAHQLLSELGPLAEAGALLGTRAAARLAAAGRRALERDDLPVAANLLGRALARLDAADPARAGLALDGCEALLSAGDVGAAAGAIDELGRLAAGDERLAAWHACFAGQLTVLTAPRELGATAETIAAAAQQLTALGDAAGEAKAHFVHALALSRLGEVGACEAALDRALAAARRAGDRRRANTVLAIAPLAALWGPSPVTRASGRCLDVVRVLRITQGAPAVEAVALSCQGVLEALRGRTEAAHRMIASARKMVEELGITQRLLEADASAGLVALLEGDAAAAERTLRSAYEGLRDLGLGIDAARAAALLARALLAQDRVAEAEALSHESEALAGDDLKAAIAWRGVRAEALAKRGEHAAAVELASRAVELAAATDALLDHADARLALAAALRAAGRGREADAEERRARELWEAKGATLLAERARHEEARPPSAASAPPLTAQPLPRRRVRPNAATENDARLGAAIGSRNTDALSALVSEDLIVVDHTTGAEFGREGALGAWRALIGAREPTSGHEPLATLGDSLGLLRVRFSASGTGGRRWDVAAYDKEEIHLVEVDAKGLRRTRGEVFATGHLADAIARLYERYAELQLPGPERERAAAAAFSLGTPLRVGGDPERMAEALASDFESVDRRRLSTWSVRGRAAFVAHMRALRDVADDVAMSVDEVLALAPSALLVRRLHSGTDRTGGGRYERAFLALFVADADGRLARAEWFDPESEAEALARFDALAAGSVPPRRVRPNTATALGARFGAAFASGDVAAFTALLAPSLEYVDHPVGASYGREAAMAGIRAQLRSREPRYRQEPLATLGDRLLVGRRTISADATVSTRFDVGPSENVTLVLQETDGAGATLQRIEVFAADRIGDAVARLYERYAALQPEGPLRTRAEAIARAVGVVAPGGSGPERYAEAFRPDVEIVDHKLLGLGTGAPRELLLRSMEASREIADQIVSRPQDVLALAPDALLLGWRVSGVGSESGGAVEWAFLRLFVFDAVGRVARYELFEANAEAAALARFEALATDPARGALRRAPAANAASRANEACIRAFNARDMAGFEEWLAPGFVLDDRRRLVRLALDATDALSQFRFLRDVPGSRFSSQLVATRGERLALHRNNFEGEVPGGGGALELGVHLDLVEVDAEGRLLRDVLFDCEDEDAAYAELDALYERGEAGVRARRAGAGERVPASDFFENAASRADRALFDRFDARDWAGIEALAAPGLVFDERRRMLHNTCGREVWLEQFRVLFDVPASRFETRLLATRGERLALNWHRFTGEVAGGGGPLEIDDALVLHEVDGEGRIVAIVLFDLEAEAAAHAELDARFEAGEAAQLPILQSALRRGRLLASRDLPDFAAMHSPGFVYRDHRRLGWGSAAHDFEAFMRLIQSAFDLSPDARYRRDHVHLCARGVWLRQTLLGTRDGGAFENPMHLILAVDEQGRVVSGDTYDVEDLERARARFAELSAPARAREPFANAAFRVNRSLGEAFNARDWARVEACLAPALVFDDRRRGVRLETSRADTLASFRHLMDIPDARFSSRLLATRGERLVLQRTRFEGTVPEGGGPLDTGEYLDLVEIDAEGRIAWNLLFDVEDEAAAHAELDARYDAGEGAAYPRALALRVSQRRGWIARDWDAFATDLAPDLVCHDHRLLGWGTLHGAAAFARTQEALLELAPDARAWSDHIVSAERGFLRSIRVTGTRDGGAFELEFVNVSALDAAGRICRIDLYGPEQHHDALARFAEIAASASPASAPFPKAARERFGNSATRTVECATAAQGARDWEAFGALFAPGFRQIDRRAYAQVEADREGFLRSHREIIEMTSTRPRPEFLATRGERLALVRILWQGAEGDVGPSEIEWLLLVEVDERGDHLLVIAFDPNDLDAAYDELDSRWAAGEASLHPAASTWDAAFRRAFASRDWEAMAALHASDQIAQNHRLVGWGTLRGPGAWVPTLEELVALAPDAEQRVHHLRTCERGLLWHHAWRGTRDGGPFESPMLVVVELDEHGRERRIDVWEPEQVAEALARFEEIQASAPSEPLAARVKPNLATAAMERVWVGFDAFDAFAPGTEADSLAAARAHFAPDFTWEDRRPLVGLSGGLDLMLASARERLLSGARHERRTVVATAGERVAIANVLWAGGPKGGRFEVEFLALHEVDEAGLCTALVFFEPSDWRAAQRDAWARWRAIEPARAAVTAPFGEILDAFDAQDRGRMRAQLADDLVVEDHRHTGVGRIEGADAQVASLAALWELAPETKIDGGWHWLACDRHGGLTVVRRTGTVPGGGPFESEFLWLSIVAGSRLARLELFEPEAVGEALARFEALRPDPLSIPPNAAVRALAQTALDEAALRALAADDFVFDDRTRRSLLRGGVEEWLRSLAYLGGEIRGRPGFRLLATAGDRLALQQTSWRETAGAGPFAIDYYALMEIDAAGRLRAMVLFGADDRAAAHAELFERWAAGGADSLPAAAISFVRAVNAHDLVAVRATLCDDFAYDDRRLVGIGRLDGADAYLPSLTAFFDLSADARIDMLYEVARAPHGQVTVCRTWGTNAEGGDFETLFVMLLHFGGGLVAGLERFELEDRGAALARLEALRPDPLRIPDNAATRAGMEFARAAYARDWEAVRGLCAPDFVFEDRGKRALVTGGVEAWIASVAYTTTLPAVRIETQRVAMLGEGICVQAIRWGSTEGAFEFGRLRLLDVDAEGRVRATLFFDPEDRFAASNEALARFAAGEAAGARGVEALVAFRLASARGDAEGVQRLLAPAFAYVDHRRVGLGTLSAAEWVASLRVLGELSADAGVEVLLVLAWNTRGLLLASRSFGSVPDGGGPFENLMLVACVAGPAGIEHFEIFEIGDAERARARFDVLCAGGGA